MTHNETHSLIAVDAMLCGKYAAMEVGGAASVEECWQLVRTEDRQALHAGELLLRSRGMTLLNMVQQGLRQRYFKGRLLHDLRDQIGKATSSALPARQLPQPQRRALPHARAG